MAIIPIEPLSLDRRDELLTDIISLIDDAAVASEPVSTLDLAQNIMKAIDHSGYTPDPVLALASPNEVTILFSELDQLEI